MLRLFNTYNTVTTDFDHCSDIEEHFLTTNQCVADENPFDDDPDSMWEPPMEFDREAAYKVWQDSLSYLVQNFDSF